MILCRFGCGQIATISRYSRRKKEHIHMCSNHQLKCPAVQKKKQETNLKKYGSDNIFKILHTDSRFITISKEIRDNNSKRMKNKSNSHIGFRNPFILEKANNAFKEKYKIDNPMHNADIKDKVIETNIKRYGVKYPICELIQYQKSKIADEWLSQFSNIDNTEYRIYYDKNKFFKVDGYDSKTNTIYEFFGNYWHGNPNLYKRDFYNVQAKKTMGELYDKTILRMSILKNMGFKIVFIWENEYNSLKNKKEALL